MSSPIQIYGALHSTDGPKELLSQVSIQQGIDALHNFHVTAFPSMLSLRKLCRTQIAEIHRRKAGSSMKSFIVRLSVKLRWPVGCSLTCDGPSTLAC